MFKISNTFKELPMNPDPSENGSKNENEDKKETAKVVPKTTQYQGFKLQRIRGKNPDCY